MIDNESLKQSVLELVSNSEKKLTQASIETMVSVSYRIKKREVRKALRELVAAAELEYTYVFGNSYVEKSFNRPVRISSSIIVKPYNMSYPENHPDIVIDIFPGISFGSGEHPTTRLSVRGIEYAVKDQKLIPNLRNSTILDIGTGSGILAIAALKLGIAAGIGVDTDPCSVSEAKKNARINGLENRLSVLTASENIHQTFSLITANLRFPDIMQLASFISKKANPGSPVVVSGIRPEEIDAVIERYGNNHFQCLLTSGEKNWSCLVFIKNN